MRSILLAILIAAISGVDAFAQSTISGNVTSSVNGKPLWGVVVSIKGTTIGGLTDSVGNYQFNAPFGNVILSANWMGYKPLDTTVSVTRNLVVDIKLKAECTFNNQNAKSDIKESKSKLLLAGGVAPRANSRKDRKFMKKYRVAYYDFGDSMIAMECIEDYNKVIFEHLDKTYGHKWRKSVRQDVIGLD